MSGTPPVEKPLVASLCGTYLKPEMQSIYRQIANLRRFRTHAYAETVTSDPQFPLERVVELQKRKRPRAKGNFILRYWWKHVRKQWPPPRPIGEPAPEYYHPYDLVDRLEEDAVDLAHVYYGHKAVKYRRMLHAWGRPWIVSFHGVDVVKFFDRPGYHDEMKRVFQEAELVLARSASLLERLEALGCPVEKLRLNRTPIPFSEQLPGPVHPPADGQWILLQACRLIGKKGILTLLEALAMLQPDYPGMRFVLCGDGPLREKIKTRARELGVAVDLLGWTSQDELIAAYRRAHVFVHPSELTKGQDQEGVPNAMLEAMAHGLPVVATRHGGIPEAITHDLDGLLAAERSPQELATHLRALFEDPALLARLSTGAAGSVRENFVLPSRIAALEDCYAEALAAFDRRNSTATS